MKLLEVTWSNDLSPTSPGVPGSLLVSRQPLYRDSTRTGLLGKLGLMLMVWT